jgi:hypothetical protein
MADPATAPTALDLHALHAGFLALLPKLTLHARVYYRHLRPDRKEEAAAEMVALAWLWYLRLVKRGKDPRQFPTAIATYAARAVASGRRLVGMCKAHDVLAPVAKRRHGFTVSPLPEPGSPTGPLFEAALVDNTQTPVPEQAAFRLDFPRWRRSRSERDQRLMDDLMAGERTQDVAAKHRLTASRVSQLRREFRRGWERFGADTSA